MMKELWHRAPHFRKAVMGAGIFTVAAVIWPPQCSGPTSTPSQPAPAQQAQQAAPTPPPIMQASFNNGVRTPPPWSGGAQQPAAANHQVSQPVGAPAPIKIRPKASALPSAVERDNSFGKIR